MKTRSRAKRHGTKKSTAGAIWRQASLVVTMFAALMLAPIFLTRYMPVPFTIMTMTVTARISGRLISLAGIPSTVVGNRIYLTNHIFRVDAACNGILWLVLYAIAVLMVPVAIKRKWQALLIGLPILVAFNFARFVMVAFVSQWYPEQFEFVHGVIMQSAFVVIALGIWGVWMWIARNDWKPGWG